MLFLKLFIKQMNSLLIKELQLLGSIFDAKRPNEVIVTQQEFCRCISIAALKLSHCNFGKRISERTTQWQNCINGYTAEYAVAKWLGITWNPQVSLPDTEIGDIPKKIQVRMTDLEDGCLIVKDTDPSDHIFIFVIGSTLTKDPPYRFKIIGTKLGKDCKKLKWQRESRAYFVPQEELEVPNKMKIMGYA